MQKPSSTSSSDAFWPFFARCGAFFAVSVLVWSLATAVLMNGHTDTFYGRFASAPQQSLVLGSSRAAVGIVPSVIESTALGYSSLFNFAFTMSTSPYGPVYLRAVRAKLANDPGARGLFLVEVSPLALSHQYGTETFPESKSFLGKMHLFSMNPNIEYPFHRRERAYDIIVRGIRWMLGRSEVLLHADGWLEIKQSYSSAQITKRISQKVESYRQSFARSKPSAARWQSLRETVVLLAKRGRVVLIRLPVGDGIRQLEHEYMPQFGDEVRMIARSEGVEYLDLIDAPFDSNDGNHLAPESARAVSKAIRKWLETGPEADNVR